MNAHTMLDTVDVYGGQNGAAYLVGGPFMCDMRLMPTYQASIAPWSISWFCWAWLVHRVHSLCVLEFLCNKQRCTSSRLNKIDAPKTYDSWFNARQKAFLSYLFLLRKLFRYNRFRSSCVSYIASLPHLTNALFLSYWIFPAPVDAGEGCV